MNAIATEIVFYLIEHTDLTTKLSIPVLIHAFLSDTLLINQPVLY